MNLIRMFIKHICGKQGFSLRGTGQAFTLTAGICWGHQRFWLTLIKEMWYKLTCCFDLHSIVYCSSGFAVWMAWHKNTWVIQRNDLVSMLKEANYGNTEFSTSLANFLLTTLLPKFIFKVSYKACFLMEHFSQKDKRSIEYNHIMLILLCWLPNRSSVGERFKAVLRCSMPPAYQVEVCITILCTQPFFETWRADRLKSRRKGQAR